MSITVLLNNEDIKNVCADFEGNRQQFQEKIQDPGLASRLQSLSGETLDLFGEHVAPNQNGLQDFLEALPVGAVNNVLQRLPVPEPLHATDQKAIAELAETLRTPRG